MEKPAVFGGLADIFKGRLAVEKPSISALDGNDLANLHAGV